MLYKKMGYSLNFLYMILFPLVDVIYVGTSIDSAETPQYRLYKDLFNDYEPHLRPVRTPSDSVVVSLGFELNTVSGLDDVNQVMYTVGFVVAEWKDEFLTWEPKYYANTKHMVVPPNKVWLPDLAIKNSAGTIYDASYTRDFRIDIRHDGRVIWAFGGNFATSCTLDMTFYPFDLQKCDIDIENWSYTREAVNLINHTNEIELQDFSTNGEWGLDHTAASVHNFTVDTHRGKTFPRVKFSIFLSRKFHYYLINIVLPALFVIAISLNVFWLPPDSGEKVSLGITVLLAISVFQLVIMEHTPRTSDFTPVMTLLFTIIMGMSTFSVLTSIMVLFFHHHGAECRPNRWIRMIAFKYLARLLRMQNQVPDYNQVILDEKEDIQQVPAKRNSSIRIAEHHTDSTPKQSPTGSPKVFFSGNPGREDYLRQILFHIKEMVDKIQVKERDGAIMEEWKSLAIVLDRSFFWIAFITTVIVIPSLLFKVDDKH